MQQVNILATRMDFYFYLMDVCFQSVIITESEAGSEQDVLLFSFVLFIVSSRMDLIKKCLLKRIHDKSYLSKTP